MATYCCMCSGTFTPAEERIEWDRAQLYMCWTDGLGRPSQVIVAVMVGAVLSGGWC